MMAAAFLHSQDMLEQLRSQSRRDGLTGLFNFQAFTEEATKAIRAAGPQGGPFSFAVADLDNLKARSISASPSRFHGFSTRGFSQMASASDRSANRTWESCR